MPGIFVGAPTPVVPPAGVVPWTALQHTWTCDGKSWDLSSLDPYAGVFLMSGVRGVNEMPPIQHYRTKSAAVPGSRWRGFSTDEREVFWPLLVAHGDGSQAWLDYDAEFWSTMEPDKTGVWSVTQPGTDTDAGETRSLTLRYESAGDPPDAPEVFGWADYGVYLHAEQPYWEGQKIRKSWSNSTPTNFYGGGDVAAHGYGPPFFVSSASSISRADIMNPGPIASRPVWWVYGPTNNASLGVDGRTIGVPFALGAGEWLRIDTNPTDQQALFGAGAYQDGGDWVVPPDALAAGVNRTRELAATTRFGAVPGRGTSALTIALTGSGAVAMDLVPLYYRDH